MVFIRHQMNSIYFDGTLVSFSIFFRFISLSLFPFDSLCYFCTQTHRLLCNEVNADDAFEFEYRGPVMMKGKAEPMNCWFLNRAKCDYPNIPRFEELMKSQIETSLTCTY